MCLVFRILNNLYQLALSLLPFFYAAPICSVNLTLLYFMRLSNDSMYCSNYFLEDIGTEMKDDIGTETNSQVVIYTRLPSLPRRPCSRLLVLFGSNMDDFSCFINLTCKSYMLHRFNPSVWLRFSDLFSMQIHLVFLIGVHFLN